MVQKKNKLVGFTAVFLIIGVLFSTLFFYAIKKDEEKEEYFVSFKAGAAEKIYTNISTLDFMDTYPKNPEAVMEVYNNTTLLLYGNMLLNHEKVKEILEIQRNLFSEEILKHNDLQEQYDNIVKSLAALKESNIYTLRLKSGSVLYDSTNNDFATIEVTQFLNTRNEILWNYYLKKEQNGEWKIYSWEVIQ